MKRGSALLLGGGGGGGSDSYMYIYFQYFAGDNIYFHTTSEQTGPGFGLVNLISDSIIYVHFSLVYL